MNGNGHDSGDEGKVVDLAASRLRRHRQEPGEPQQKPLINLPPATKAMIILLLLAHCVLQFFFNDEQRFTIFMTWGFVPGHYTGTLPFILPALAAPVTHMLLHGNWMHLAINGLMLAAFGAGAERWMGSRRMIALALISGLFATAFYFIFSPFSKDPVIGASGALNGLFAAVIVMMTRARAQAGMGRNSLAPFIAIWLVVTVLFGMTGTPGGDPVAWTAHISGFIGGFAALRLMKI